MKHRTPRPRFGRLPADDLTKAALLLLPLTLLALAAVAMTIWW